MDLNSLDPQRAYCDTCQIYLAAVYQTLIGIDVHDPSKQVPRLAESWEASADNTRFTFELDPEATFSDGSPVEATDVKWSWERLANLQGPASYLMSGYEEIETPDAHTVVVTFEEPNSAFLSIVSASYMGIVNSDVASEHQAEAGPDAAETDQAEQWFLEQSAGSGPFVLSSYVPNETVELQRNDNFWQQESPFPGVQIKQVKESASQLQQMQQNEADIAMQISFQSMSQLQGVENVEVDTVDSNNFVYVALSPGAQRAGASELEDEQVRRAIKLAIDYDGMIDTVVQGHGRKQASPIPNGFPGSADLPLPSQDLDQARSLMSEAGQSDGFTLEGVYPNVNVYGVDLNVLMQKVEQDLSEINVDVELQPVPFTQWSDTINQQGIPLTAVYFAPDYPGSSQYVQYFGLVPDSSWAERAGGGSAGEPLEDPTEERLYQEVLSAGGDEATELYTELGQEMMDDAIILPMVNPSLVLASASDITNMHYSACCNLELGQLGLQ